MRIGAEALPLGEAQRAATKAQQSEQSVEQFEGLLIRQLIATFRESLDDQSLFGSGAGSQLYAHFFDEALTESWVRSGGLGMKETLAQQLGVQLGEGDSEAGAQLKPLTRALNTSSDYALRDQDTRAPQSLGDLAPVARQLSADSAQWARDARLDTEALASEVSLPVEGGTAHFNVHDARGYEGYAKCNLFALEVARRGGYQVPVVGRSHGLGFPGANQVARDAADGSLQSDWGRVVTGSSVRALNDALGSGERAYLLAGSGAEGHEGHMAVVAHIHHIDYDAEGQVQRIDFDGWEAQVDGARFLQRRTWNRQGQRKLAEARNHLDDIAIVELQRREGAAEVLLNQHAGPSLKDRQAASELPAAATAPSSKQGAEITGEKAVVGARGHAS